VQAAMHVAVEVHYYPSPERSPPFAKDDVSEHQMPPRRALSSTVSTLTSPPAFVFTPRAASNSDRRAALLCSALHYTTRHSTAQHGTARLCLGRSPHATRPHIPQTRASCQATADCHGSSSRPSSSSPPHFLLRLSQRLLRLPARLSLMEACAPYQT
jgi:hypothetical protein